MENPTPQQQTSTTPKWDGVHAEGGHDRQEYGSRQQDDRQRLHEHPQKEQQGDDEHPDDGDVRGEAEDVLHNHVGYPVLDEQPLERVGREHDEQHAPGHP